MQGLQTDYVSPVMGFDINFRNKVIVVSDMDFIILHLEKKKIRTDTSWSFYFCSADTPESG